MSDADEQVDDRNRGRPPKQRRDDGGRSSGLTATQAARRAAEQLSQLITRELESVVGVRSEGGTFTVVIEAVEDPHVPSSADVMAEYEVQLDAEGELTGYRRRSRYVRGRTEEG